MKKKKHRLIAALFVGAGFLAMAWTLGYAGFGGPSAEALPVELTGEQAPAGAVAVTLQSVALRPVQRTIETVGTLHPFEQVIECAKVEGRVRRIVHDVGDRVKPGDLLLEVDPKVAWRRAGGNLGRRFSQRPFVQCGCHGCGFTLYRHSGVGTGARPTSERTDQRRHDAGR